MNKVFKRQDLPNRSNVESDGIVLHCNKVGEEISVDETMISLGGRLLFWQYDPRKTIQVIRNEWIYLGFFDLLWYR